MMCLRQYVQSCILKLDSNILEKYFSEEVDIALMNELKQMTVENYNLELEKMKTN